MLDSESLARFKLSAFKINASELFIKTIFSIWNIMLYFGQKKASYEVIEPWERVKRISATVIFDTYKFCSLRVYSSILTTF